MEIFLRRDAFDAEWCHAALKVFDPRGSITVLRLGSRENLDDRGGDLLLQRLIFGDLFGCALIRGIGERLWKVGHVGILGNRPVWTGLGRMAG